MFSEAISLATARDKIFLIYLAGALRHSLEYVAMSLII